MWTWEDVRVADDLPSTAGGSFWNICWHPAEQQIESPDRPGNMICGKCGANYQATLDYQLLLESFQAVARQSGSVMPELGLDLEREVDCDE